MSTPLSSLVSEIVYRGEHGARDEYIIQSRLGSISFGTRQAAEVYAESPNVSSEKPVSPRVISAEITIGNPVMNRPDDPFIEFNDLLAAVGHDKAIQILKRLDAYVKHTNNWEDNFSSDFFCINEVIDRAPERLPQIYFDAYPVFDEKEFVEWFSDAGFDGAIHGGNGLTALETEYKVFSINQIKIVKVENLDTALCPG